MKLQINTAGSWRDVLTFDASRRTEVVLAAVALTASAGADAKWCLVDDAGTREWIARPIADVMRGARL